MSPEEEKEEDKKTAVALFPPGTVVEIANVKSKPELNGKSARVIQFDAEKNRFLVQVLSETKEGEKISLKQKCLVKKMHDDKDDGEKDVKVEEK